MSGFALEACESDGVDEAFEFGDVGAPDFEEVRALGVPAGDKTCGVFNGTFFLGGVCVGVVDFARKEVHEGFRI